MDSTLEKCIILLFLVGASAVIAGELIPGQQEELPMGVWVTDIHVGDPGNTFYPTSDGGWTTERTGLMTGNGQVIPIPGGVL